jgi:hypothetical protein
MVELVCFEGGETGEYVQLGRHARAARLGATL